MEIAGEGEGTTSVEEVAGTRHTIQRKQAPTS